MKQESNQELGDHRWCPDIPRDVGYYHARPGEALALRWSDIQLSSIGFGWGSPGVR